MERVSREVAVDLAARVANIRSLWLCTVTLMLDRGLLSKADVEWMREHCIETALAFSTSGDGLKREFGLRGVDDVAALFTMILPEQP